MTEELATEFDAHAKDAMGQYNATDWNSKSKRAGMIAKAQTWQKAAGLVRNAIITPNPLHAAAPDMRRNKPWLFGGDNSSAPATPPLAHASKARNATEMTDAEWRAARAELVGTR